MAGFRIEGNTSGNVAEVNAANQLKITAETDVANNPANVGSIKFFTENDSGSATGIPYLKSPETSPDYRLRTGTDSVLFTDNFNSTTQNTNLWAYTSATLTAAQPGAGTLNFSAVQGTTAAHGAFMRSYQYFPLVNTAPISCEFFFQQANAPLVANEVWLMGLGLPSAATTVPTDGAWVKITTAGLVGVISYSGTQTESGILKAFNSLTLGESYKLTIVVAENEIEYWLDDTYLGEQLVPTSNGTPFMASSAPVFMMKYNTGTVANTNTMRVARVGVTLFDIDTARPWSVTNSVMGQNAYVGQNGHTMGSTQATGTITTGSSPLLPTATAGSNTAANSVGLGGVGAFNAVAAAATDIVANSYQNPAPSINITGRNLIVKGIKISAINTGAVVATTPTTIQWSIAFGHTAVSFATTESASFATGTTHAPRRVVLGFQYAPIGAVIGQPYTSDIYMPFDSPIVVRPGEFLATMAKIVVGTATASQTITYAVTYDANFE